MACLSQSDMNNKKQEFDILNRIFSNVPIKQADSETSLKDKWQTKQQQERDIHITKLLSFYVNAYDRKMDFVSTYRKKIVEVLLAVLVAIVIVMIVATGKAFFNSITSVEQLVGLISAYTSFSVLIIGLIKTITEYVFPKDDEQYITQIVRSIQKNDLENKRANIEAENLEKEHNVLDSI